MTTTLFPSDDDIRELQAEVLARNAASPDPWPVCTQCGQPHHETESHWIYSDVCDTCGTTRLEGTVGRFLRARTDAAATRALRGLESRSVRRRRPSMASIKRAAQRRVDACAMAKALELDIVLTK